MSSHHHRPTTTTTTTNRHHSPPSPPPPPPPPSPPPNITTTLHHTHIGIFALTWSRTLFTRSLRLHLLPSSSAAAADDDGDSISTASSYHTAATTATASFHLQIKPLIFWNRHGSKKLPISPNNNSDFIHIYYDLSRAKFGSGPEPLSGYYIAAVVSGEMILLVGDSPKQAFSKTKSTQSNKSQITVLRREHVSGISNKKYTTKATFRGRTREITIDCSRVSGGSSGEDSRLNFSVDGKRVLVVKHLQWKFRGNARVEIDGVHIQISWDVHNWLSEEEIDDSFALFMFRFEKSGFDYHEDDKLLTQLNASGSSVSGIGSGFGFGFEMKKMKKEKLKRAKSSSSSSLSSVSSGCGSVMEWESVEESELKGPCGFSLVVYGWKN